MKHNFFNKNINYIYLVLGGLYLAQGIPTYLLLVAMPPILRENGVSRTLIGLFSFLMLPLILKFLVAPIVDRHALVKQWGHRRSWIIPTQILISCGIIVLGFISPDNTIVVFGLCLGIMTLSSIQHITTDGYAVQNLSEHTRPYGNAIQAGAIALGVVLGGTLTLVLYHYFGWRTAMLVVAYLNLLPLSITHWLKDPELSDVVINKTKISLAAFFKRPDAWIVLCFALSYRASEGLVRGMESTYLVDIGVPLDWIGYLSGTAAASAGLLGAGLAAILIRKTGLTFVLVMLGLLRSFCFLIFALNALDIVPGIAAAMSVSALQTFIRYMELVAIYSLFMSVSSSNQPGTDFSILSCAELIIYLAGTSIAGFLTDKLGYPALFSISTVLSLCGVGLAAFLLLKLKHYNALPAPSPL